MSDPTHHSALERLERFDRAGRRPARTPRARTTPEVSAPNGRMGYQPALDGVRAVSVIAVILYHAGFSWMHGGFFGVEVFFVVSGFLITSLLVEERDRAGRVDLRQFWVRRWRRLLPALVAVLVAVSVWVVFWGSLEQRAQMRRDLPWAIGYLANWGQIVSETPYFAGTPTLLRHLWSLAVEEQWYVLWPLAFMVIGRRAADDRRRGRSLIVLAVLVMIATALAWTAEWPTRWGDPANALYLSTVSRSSGLLLGAAMAFLWRPWRITHARRADASRSLDLAALVALGVLVVAFAVGRVDSGTTYVALLPLVTIASAVVIAVAVHPWSALVRPLFSRQPLVEIGKRSYGLYLWSWPISRMCDAYSGSVGRFVLAMAITVPVSEVSYRFIETPIRQGVLGRWWNDKRRRDWNTITLAAGTTVIALLVPLTLYFASAPTSFDAARDTSSGVVFDPKAVGAVTTTTAPTAEPSTSAAPVTDPAASIETTTTTAPVAPTDLPRRMVIVGDSTAHSLAINMPDGIESTFLIEDGSVEGCSVYDTGVAVSSRNGYTRTFSTCEGWDAEWIAAAERSDAQLALVVIGAWDVFDVELDGQVLAFGTQANDDRFVAGVQRGIDALVSTGAKVALLEIPCMRPQDVSGAGVPALPERGMDDHVARLNDLLRQVAAANPVTTTFVAGPPEYCADPAIASDLGYRWDGVHAYKPGAKLTIEAAAAALLAIPVG